MSAGEIRIVETNVSFGACNTCIYSTANIPILCLIPFSSTAVVGGMAWK